MLTEKYDFSEQDATDMADFLVPILDFVPEKRPTAAQLLSHPWLNPGPRLLQPSDAALCQNGDTGDLEKEKDDREAMEAGMGNIAIGSKSEKVSQSKPNSSK